MSRVGSRFWLWITVACLALASTPGSLALAGFEYNVRDLGVLAGGSQSFALGISSTGLVTGYGNLPGSGSRAFVSGTGGLVNLGVLPNYASSQGNAVNASGMVAGFSQGPAGGNASTMQAMTAQANSTPQAINYLPGQFTSFATGINDGGRVVGYGANLQGQFQGFVVAAGSHTPTALTGFTPLGATEAFAISNSGLIVGSAALSNGAWHAMATTGPGSTAVDLGTLAGGSSSYALAVSENGSYIVGYGDVAGGATHAFLYSASGGIVDLGTLGGTTSSIAQGVNDARDIVGQSGSAGGGIPFLDTPANGMQNLNALVDPSAGFSIQTATGINNNGQISATGIDADGHVHGLLLTPVGGVPEPSSLVILLLGGAAFALFNRLQRA